MSTPRKNWARDELLVAFNLYCRTPFGRLHQSNPDVVAAAKALGRTPGSVAMKLVNFASLDPVQKARGIKGLKNAAAADEDVFKEFDQDWERLAVDSEAAMARLGLAVAPAADDQGESDAAPIGVRRTGPTEVLRLTKVRTVQRLFRDTVLASYDFACAISGINAPELLVASHIVPWAKSETRRLDPRNGLALSALHDRAFDRGLIALDKDLRVVISSRLKSSSPPPGQVSALLAYEGKRIRPPSRFQPDLEALAEHRDTVFVA